MKIRCGAIKISLIAALFLAGCSTNVSSKIALPIVPPPTGLSDVGKGAMVFVEEVKDLRPTQDLGTGPSGGRIEPIGNPAATVRDSLEQLLQQSGFTVTDSAPIVLQVKLKRWSADVKGGMSARVTSEAEFAVEVYDPGNKLAYTGTYKGSSEIEQSGLDDRVVKDGLTTSLTQAMAQFAKDMQIQKLIASF